MWLFHQSMTAARTALVYITLGALTVVWTIIWFVYLLNNPPESGAVYYFCAGFLITGLTLMVIGFGMGPIGRSAQQASLPPPDATVASVNAPTAVAPTSPVVSPNMGTPVLLPDNPVGVARMSNT